MPAIASVTDHEVSHYVYSHTHQDHAAGAGSLNLPPSTEIIGNAFTAATLTELNVRTAATDSYCAKCLTFSSCEAQKMVLNIRHRASSAL